MCMYVHVCIHTYTYIIYLIAVAWSETMEANSEVEMFEKEKSELIT